MSSLGTPIPSRTRRQGHRPKSPTPTIGTHFTRVAVLGLLAVAVAGGPVYAQSPGPADPVAGTWHTDHLTQDQIVSAFIAAGGSAAEAPAFFAQLGDGAREYAVIGMRFDDGAFTEFESGDGHAQAAGYRAAYTVGSDGTLTITTGQCTGTYDIERSGDRLALHPIEQCEGDGPYNTTLFASYPFYRDTAAVATPAPLRTAGAAVDYQSQAFAVPLSVTLEPAIAPAPSPDAPGLLSFDSATSDNDKIRFLLPETVLPPGADAFVAPPSDLTGYLLGQADHGVEFTDRSEITVDGHPATIVTATTPEAIDDSIGCVTMPDQSQGCYGFLPEYLIRMAVIDLGDGRSIVSWARTASDAPNQAFLDLFERTLATVRFGPAGSPPA